MSSLPDRVLYHCLAARSFRPLWALEELGLAYDLRILPFPPRVHAREFKRENPLGTIPLYIEGEVRMTESVAICQYLGDRHSPGGLALRVDEPEYPTYLNDLQFGEATLTFPQTLILRYARLEPPERQRPEVAEDYTVWFLGRLRALEERLETRQWLCAGRFTMADIAVGYALVLATHLGLADRFSPAVAAYVQRYSARPGFRAARAAEDAAAAAAGLKPLFA